jgi:cytochrome P450
VSLTGALSPFSIFTPRRAMAHDPSVYPNHEEFAPERFFDHEGNLNNDDFILAYGFGRRSDHSSTQIVCWPDNGINRVCAGQHLASSTVSIFILDMLIYLHPLNQRCGILSHPFWRLLLSEKP